MFSALAREVVGYISVITSAWISGMRWLCGRLRRKRRKRTFSYSAQCVLQTTLCHVALHFKADNDLQSVVEGFTPALRASPEVISVAKGQKVEVLERSHSQPDWCLVRILENDCTPARIPREGFVPTRLLIPIGDTECRPYCIDSSSTERSGMVIKNGGLEASKNANFMKRHRLRRFFSRGASSRRLKEDFSLRNGERPPRAFGSSASLPAAPQHKKEEHVKIAGVTPPLASEEDLAETDLCDSSSMDEPAINGDDVCNSLVDKISIPERESENSSSVMEAAQKNEPKETEDQSVPCNSTTHDDSQEQYYYEEAVVFVEQPRAEETNAENYSKTVEESIDAEEEEEEAPTVQKSPAELAREKRRYVLMELVETERDYVKDLGSIVDGYMKSIADIELPEDMQGKDRIVFANIQQIHDFHKNTFLNEIEKCLEDYEASGRAFVKYERRLHMYVVYCQNKPKSEFLVQGDLEPFFNDLRVKLGHKLSLQDLLIKPVQRIMKYQLLLKDILKYTERGGDDADALKKANAVMQRVPKACDDMMHVGRLQGFEGKITAQGKLLFQDTVSVSDNPPNQPFKGKDRRLFIFEQSCIIADCILPRREFSNPTYIYKSHMMVNKMSMEPEVADEPLRIILKESRSEQGGQQLLMETGTLEEKEALVLKIKQLLDTQQDFLRALQQPIAYQKGLDGRAKDELKKGKSPIMSRLQQLKPGGKPHRTESFPVQSHETPETITESSELGPDEPRKRSLPPGKNGSKPAPQASPKPARSKLFQGFRNTFKSKSSGYGVKSPSTEANKLN